MNRRAFIELSSAGLAGLPARRQHARPTVATTRARRPLPKSEFEYVDWSWERWKEISGESRPTLVTPQTGAGELVPLVSDGDTASSWPAARTRFRNALQAFLGKRPAASVPLDPIVTDGVQEAKYERRTVSLRVAPGERMPAFLLIPNGLRGPAPAALCPHQTTQLGMKEPAGLAGSRPFTAADLAERGFVTVTWDALCFGTRYEAARGHYGDAIPFYQRHPHWSLLGKMVADASRAVDYLLTLSEVDGSKIASIGHSHGGITTLWTMAFDDRVAAGVSNCGYDTFRIDGNTWRWSHATALLPRLGFYISSPYITMDRYRAMPDSEVVQTPVDHHMLLALIAPRPLLLLASDEDFVFPNGGWSTRRSTARVAPVYDLLGAGDRFAQRYFTGGHRFPPAQAERAYEWLARWLN